MSAPVVHTVDMSDSPVLFDAVVCAIYLLRNGASPRDLLEIRNHGNLVRVSELGFAARNSGNRYAGIKACGDAQGTNERN
jgi:hypothetical protein